MCKVAAVAGVNDENREGVWKFMRHLSKHMSIANNDGLGYAAFDKNNNIFGERWLYNKEAFRTDINPNVVHQTKKSKKKKRRKHKKWLQYYKKADDSYGTYNFFGTVKKQEAKAIILHTRMATCAVNMKNTHPFVDNEDNPEFAIIHNGVIYNDNYLTKKTSTCDSEVILHEYIDSNVVKDPANVSGVFEKLHGWFAVPALAKNAEGSPVLDLFKDSTRVGSLVVKELGVRFYSTSLDDLIKTCFELDLTPENSYNLKADTIRRINVDTGILEYNKEVPVNYVYEDDYTDYMEDYYLDSTGEFTEKYFNDLYSGIIIDATTGQIETGEDNEETPEQKWKNIKS